MPAFILWSQAKQTVAHTHTTYNSSLVLSLFQPCIVKPNRRRLSKRFFPSTCFFLFSFSRFFFIFWLWFASHSIQFEYNGIFRLLCVGLAAYVTHCDWNWFLGSSYAIRTQTNTEQPKWKPNVCNGNENEPYKYVN